MNSAGLPIVTPDDAHNRELLRNLHPANWKNPTPDGRYNLVVLGAGTAGLVSSAGGAALGAKVALIERHLLGGDCTNYGCVPSKAVIRSARAAFALREASDFGISAQGGGAADFPRVMERMRRLRAQISANDSAERFTKLGADVYLGDARFTGKHEIEVAGQRLSFAKAIIATGARAAALDLPGFAEAGYLTNETVFSLEQLPKTLLVIGAGPIGCELAQTFRRLGSEVVLADVAPRLLPIDDADAAKIVQRRFEREGIRTLFGSKALRAERADGKRGVVFERAGKVEQIVADEILVAVGRKPNLEGLQLEAAGVKAGAGGVVVDDRLCTTNRDIYAAGDVCSPYKFTHAAEAMARVAIQNALFFGRKHASDLVVPWATYTDPEVAHVGITEKEAAKRGDEVITFTKEFADTDRAILDGETEGYVRLYMNGKNGKLLGATIVGSHAGESIGEAVLAIRQNLSVGDLSGVIHPYPTQAEAIKRAADLQYRSRLKPWMRRVLDKYFKYRR
ncbi:MAG: mercuric reductase [Acidobacteria bacterium]|nr:mercuric reductase [Acidobacteriota bacterium]